MSETQSSYRQIMKATSIFGGVQAFNITINIIRSKFLAILLGPSGFGIMGLLTATISMISALTNFGISTSAVKDIAEAYAAEDSTRVSVVVSVFRKLVWITGILGSIITLLFSAALSEITFGNNDYTWAFVWISITLFFNQISAGQGVLLRATRQIKSMAKAAMIGSALGLLFTVPLYYFLGLNGIVPGIIITALLSLFLNWFYAHKIVIKPVFVSTSSVLKEGKGMLKMGFLISLSGLIGTGCSYLVRLYISNSGGIEEVGLYNAGFAIVNTYVGLIFTAMATDYYPRLASVSSSNKECRAIINHQSEIAILILAPIITLFLVFINYVVIILYSSQFIKVNEMILYAALGMFFKAASWAIGFVFLAKGASKVFFFSELAANTYMVLLNVIGYKYLNLTGMGLSFLIGYLLVLVQVYLISKSKYRFSFTSEFVRVYLIQFAFAVSCLIIVKFIFSPYSYLFGSLLITLSTAYSWRELDKRLDLKAIIREMGTSIGKGGK